MITGTVTVEIYLGDVFSLKEKRQIVRSAIDRVRPVTCRWLKLTNKMIIGGLLLGWPVLLIPRITLTGNWIVF